MRPALLIPSLAAALIFAARPLAADADLAIHTQLFALDAAASAAVRLESTDPEPTNQGAVRILRAPATLRWGESRLELQGDTVGWLPADRLPAGIKLIADTPVPVGPTGHAVLRCIASAQYMERLPAGTFALRQIEADAPDAPRYVLAFRVVRNGSSAVELAVSCRPEIAIARRRAPLEGVQMPVGKPLVDVFADEIHFTIDRGRWLGLLIRPPAPFEAGALALVKIDAAPAAAPPAASVPRKRDRTIAMSISANRIAAESAADRPSPSAPVGYLLYDGGFGEYGAAIAGTRAPAAGPIRAAWQDALAHAGYRPAGADRPPKVVLIYHWGVTRWETRAQVPSLATYASPSDATTTLHEKAFFTLAAYDHADFAAGFRTLLWRVRAETGDVANLPEVFPALITASTSWLGQNQERPSTATIQLAAQRVVTAPPTENDPTAAGTIDEARVRALIENSQRALTRRRSFTVYDDARQPLPPLPAGKR